jgi:hypothetical protein
MELEQTMSMSGRPEKNAGMYFNVLLRLQ